MHDRFRGILAASALSLGIATALGAAPAHAQAEQARATYGFDLPAQPLADSLRAIARQTGANVLFESKDVEGVAAPALRTTGTASEAIERVLAGTGLSARRTAPGTVVIRRTHATGARAPSPAPGGAATPPDPADEDEATPGAAAGATTMDTMVVTGTRIRGGSTPSPLIAIGAERIQEEGFADLGEVIRSLPQNFSGGQNPGVSAGATLGSGGYANQNFSGGSSLNLRGLGPDATLTLLNGRRMSYGGYVQAVDIDAIPVEAVERIEIVPDGASAVYGSDAVGGVGNVILKRDFEGVTIGTRYGGATDGGLATREYSLTAGAQWTGGGVIATYKDNSADPIHADQRRYTDDILAPTTIYPGGDLRSVLISAHQSLGDFAELRLDALNSRRNQLYNYYYSSSTTSYNRVAPETAATLLAPGIVFFLPNDWTVSVGSTRGKDELDNRSFGVNVAAGAATLNIHECLCNENRSHEVGAEGPLMALPAGDARLAIGAGYRSNTFEYFNQRTNAAAIDAEQSSRFAYAELNAPLAHPSSNLRGVHRLELTAAVRNEDYDSFGSVTTPRLGLIYGPSPDFTFKATWGRSFKAPTLYQMHAPRYAQLFPASYVGGTGFDASATALIQGGGNSDLSPERARTWSASLAYHPEAVPGLEAELTWFRIHYTDRVVQPITNATRALSDSNYVRFIEYAPTPQSLAELLASVQNFYNSTGTAYDASDVVAIVRYGYANVAEQRIEGLDLSGSYRTDLGSGQLSLRGSVAWLASTQKTTPAESAFDVAGTLFNPAKVSGRLGTVWSRGGLSWSLFGNYRSGVTNTVDDKKTASFTTFDTTLSYALDRPRGLLSGVELSLSVQNVFDRQPPLYTPSSWIHVPYDSTNYSAIGRFLSVSVSKHF